MIKLSKNRSLVVWKSKESIRLEGEKQFSVLFPLNQQKEEQTEISSRVGVLKKVTIAPRLFKVNIESCKEIGKYKKYFRN